MTDAPRREPAGGEFALIAALRERWGELAPGLGDDASISLLPRGERLVASTDAAVEDVHFRRDWLTPRQIGRRAVVAALSDIAAMGATPVGVLLAFAAPAPGRQELLLAIGDGCADAVREAGTVILGGNIASAGELSIVTTVLGHAFAPLARSGATPGDTIYVTGRLGGPAAALRALTDGRYPTDASRERLAAPAPRLREGRWLATRGVRACIDVSDGLVADAGHLARASGVTLEIDADRVPRLEDVTRDDALAGGEEYELLVAAPSLDVAAFEATFGIPLTSIGRVATGTPEVVVVAQGKRVATPPGYDHFSR